MYQSLLNFFTFVNSQLVSPLATSINNSGIIQNLLTFLENFLKAFFRLWNNDNTVLDNFNFNNFSYVICEILGVLFIFLIIKLAISIVNVFFSTIKGVLR